MEYEIHDNFLPENEFKELQELITSDKLPWYRINSIVSDKDPVFEDGSDAGIYQGQFVHIFYNGHEPKSPFYKDIAPLLKKIKPKAIVRIKANLLTATPNRVISGLHTDLQNTWDNLKTAVFYINTNNGSTLFKDGTEIESIANRLVIFKSNLEHTSVSCTDQKARYVINLNYYDQ